MTIFERAWNFIQGLLAELIGIEAPVVIAWAKQFASDEGKIILTDAAQYGPQIYAGTITITDAFTKLTADLTAKGLTDLSQLANTMYNALRTQTNAASTASTSDTTS